MEQEGTGGLRDSELSMIDDEDDNRRGELYNRLWGHAKF
jgi:hypothetical protein